EMFEVIRASDMVILLVSDAAMAKLYSDVFAALRPGTTLGLSHGFLLGYLNQNGEEFPADVDVIAVCPKGMGASVRALYLQGGGRSGPGTSGGSAVHRAVPGRAPARAGGWSGAPGAPYPSQTTLQWESLSDISGERALLLGAVPGIGETLYRRYRDLGMTDED